MVTIGHIGKWGGARSGPPASEVAAPPSTGLGMFGEGCLGRFPCGWGSERDEGACHSVKALFSLYVCHVCCHPCGQSKAKGQPHAHCGRGLPGVMDTGSRGQCWGPFCNNRLIPVLSNSTDCGSPRLKGTDCVSVSLAPLPVLSPQADDLRPEFPDFVASDLAPGLLGLCYSSSSRSKGVIGSRK